MVQKTSELALKVSSNGAPTSLKQFLQLEKGNVSGEVVGIMIAGETKSQFSVSCKSQEDYT